MPINQLLEWMGTLFALLAATIAAWAGGDITKKGQLPELPKAPGATQPAAPTPPPAAPVTFGNGTHQVGVDIRAGTYRTPGPERSYCFWRRLDRNQEWIDFGSSSGPIVVVIRSTDWGFESSGCKPWKRR